MNIHATLAAHPSCAISMSRLHPLDTQVTKLAPRHNFHSTKTYVSSTLIEIERKYH